MSLNARTPNPTVRLPAARPEDAGVLRRLARRLGQDPDVATGHSDASSDETSRSEVAAASLASDPSLRIDAALGKCQGLIEGRAAVARLSSLVETASEPGDLEALSQAAAEIRRSAQAGRGCPHKAAGFAAVALPALEPIETRLAARRTDLQKARLLSALREVLADEIDDARVGGASAQDAASLLLARRDLLGDLPLDARDLAGIGRSIAEEAAPDPALATALTAAADALDGQVGPDQVGADNEPSR